MTLLNRISKKGLTRYYYLITILYALGLFLLPYGHWNFTPVFYMFLGFVLLSILHRYLAYELNRHVNRYHADLMKKYSVHYSVMKGKVLNHFDIVQNKKEFANKKDQTLDHLVQLYSQSVNLSIVCFFTTVIMLIPRILLMPGM